MKPQGMSWGYFFKKHYELWPLMAAVGFGMADLALFIANGYARKDYLATRVPYSWDKRDLLKHPYHRKLLHFNQEYDVLSEMDQAYRDMDAQERELARKRKRARAEREKARAEKDAQERAERAAAEAAEREAARQAAEDTARQGAAGTEQVAADKCK